VAKYGIIGPGYQGRSTNINASRCINLYPELNPRDSKSVGSLVGTPGLLLYVDTTLGPIRCAHFFNNLIYFVSGNKLYSVNAAKDIFPIVDAGSGNQVELATLDGRVSMADNGLYGVGGGIAHQLAFVDGVNVYVVNVSTFAFNSFAVPAQTIAFIGGYFMIDKGGAEVAISNLYDGTVWPALAFSTADSYPDNLNCVVNNHNEAWLFGEYSAEIWVPDGTSNPFPFSRMAVIDYGTIAPHSIAKGNNTIFCLVSQRNGNAGEIFGVGMVNGYGMEIVTPQSINYHISKYTEVSDAWGYCYTDNGHEFYVLTFPSANATWVYDATTGLCHERSYYSGDPYQVNRHIGNAYAHAWGKHFVGSYVGGKIYEMSEDYYTDNGEPIASVRVAPPIDDNNVNMFISKLQLDAETGVGSLAPLTGIVSKVTPITVEGGPIHIIEKDNFIYVSSTSLPNNNVTIINKVTDKKTTISLGIYQGRGMAIQGNYLFVASTSFGVVVKIDLTTNTIVSNIPVGGTPIEIISDGISVWVDDESAGGTTVKKINPITDVVTNVIVGTSPRYLFYDAGYVYTCNFGSDNVSKIDISTDTVSATIAVGTQPYYITKANTHLWISNWGSANVSKINIATDVVDATVVVGLQPLQSVFDNSSLWVVNEVVGSISKIDVATDTVTATLAGVVYRAIVFDGVDIWTNVFPSIANRINITTNAVTATVGVGTDIYYGMASGYYVWFVGYASNNVTKIQVAQQIDPRALLSWSKDGGHTWSNDHPTSMGMLGQYLTRMIWRRLGAVRNRCFRIAITAAVKKVLIGAYMELKGGAS